MATVALLSRPQDPRRLAQDLAAQGLPGQRSMTAITRLRRQRERNRPVPAPRRVVDRVQEHLIAQISDLIHAQGGETSIDSGHTPLPLAVQERDVASRLTLVGVSGMRRYGSRSRGTARFAELTYLSGVDEAGRWVIRVPATCTTIAQALAWSVPAEVTRIAQEGRRTAQRGGVYAVETTPTHDGKGTQILDEDGLVWNAATRFLVHRPAAGPRYRPLNLKAWAGVRFVPRKSLTMGR